MIIRSYNSFYHDITSDFHNGWTFNHNTYLEDNIEYVLWYDGDGSVHKFTSLGGGIYDPPPGVHALFNKNLDDTFTLWFQSGIRYEFDINGVLQTKTDKNGNSLTHTYSGENLEEIQLQLVNEKT